MQKLQVGEKFFFGKRHYYRKEKNPSFFLYLEILLVVRPKYGLPEEVHEDRTRDAVVAEDVFAVVFLASLTTFRFAAVPLRQRDERVRHVAQRPRGVHPDGVGLAVEPGLDRRRNVQHEALVLKFEEAKILNVGRWKCFEQPE